MFLFSGDEKTWQLGEWAWDPHVVAAAPASYANSPDKPGMAKRQRLDMLPFTATAPPSDQPAPQGCCNQNGGPNAGSSCSFQLHKPFCVSSTLSNLGAMVSSNYLAPPHTQTSRLHYPPHSNAPLHVQPSMDAVHCQEPCLTDMIQDAMGISPLNWPHHTSSTPEGVLVHMDDDVWLGPPGADSHMQQQQQRQQPRNTSGVSAACQVHTSHGFSPSVQSLRPRLSSRGGAPLLTPPGAFSGDMNAMNTSLSGGTASKAGRQYSEVELAAAAARGVISLSDEPPSNEAEKMMCQVSRRHDCSVLYLP
jgi:hypothetical protein